VTCGSLPDAGALLHQAERWPALFIQRNDFAVENPVWALTNLERLVVQKLSSEIVLIAGDQPVFAAFQETNSAIAVHFVQ